MLCILNIAVDILKKPIAYKYYVHTLELKNSSDGYEDLQEADTYDAIVNRCLSIPELARQKGGKSKGEYALLSIKPYTQA